MVSKAELREQLRPQGRVSLACDGCQFRELCGGYHNGQLFGNCFDELCCHFTEKDKANCNAVCPYKGDFTDWLADARGLRFDDLPTLEQPPVSLPAYVPMIDHDSSRNKSLSWPLVALNTYSVLSVRRSTRQYEAKASSPEALREAYLLEADTGVILRGVGNDPQLEAYWRHRIVTNAPSQLARLNIHSAIGPNFSHFLDVPRTDHIYNKRRQLLCLLELAQAGIPVVPHLNSVSPGDWVFWRQYLESNQTIQVVAIEFQTGNKNLVQGHRVLDSLKETQHALGRSLHPVLVGGGRFVEYAAARFSSLTLVDSTPFHKTMRRFGFEQVGLEGCWQDRFTLYGQKLDGLLYENIAAYSAWIEHRMEYGRRDCGKDSTKTSDKDN